MIDVASVFSFEWSDDFFDRVKGGSIASGMGAASFIPALEMFQLDCETCTLNRIHAAIPTDNRVMVFPCLPVIAQDPNLIGKFEIIRDNGTCLAQRAEIFSRIKAEASNFAD
jgi:hypothetical protein